MLTSHLPTLVLFLSFIKKNPESVNNWSYSELICFWICPFLEKYSFTSLPIILAHELHLSFSHILGDDSKDLTLSFHYLHRLNWKISYPGLAGFTFWVLPSSANPWYSNCDPRTSRISVPRGLSELHNLGPHPKPTEARFAFWQALQMIVCMWRFEKHCS